MDSIWNDDTTGPSASSLDTALKEPDFITRAIKLFNLREDLWTSFDKRNKEIEEETGQRAEQRARTPGRIALAIGAGAAIAAVAVIAAPVDLFIMGLAGVAALVVGFGARGLVRAIAKDGPETAGEEAQEALKKLNDKLQSRIDQEVQTMDKSLLSQPPEVRTEFRSAFDHAALKQEVRENRIHRAKMEQEAEETREAAQTAATMSTMAAMSASMRR